MPCDRCGGAMDTYELDGRDARSCRECGYVDVPVRHEPEGGHRESWDDAISRFYERFADVTVSENDQSAEGTADGSPDETSPEDSPEDTAVEEPSAEASTTDAADETSTDTTDETSTSDASEDVSTSESPGEASAIDA